MAKRTLSAIANIVIDRVDKSRSDSTFKTFVEDQAVLTLQEIISEVPHARWLMESFSISLVADQAYVDLDADVDIDSFVSLADRTNDYPLVRIDPRDADVIDPGRDLSGEAILWWFQRVGGTDRAYFINLPDDTDSLVMVCGEKITDPTSGSTTALPAKYEYGWIEGTLSKVWERLDPSKDTTKLDLKFERFLAKVRKDANANPGQSEVMVSHRPHTSGGDIRPRFPSDFDVLP